MWLNLSSNYVSQLNTVLAAMEVTAVVQMGRINQKEQTGTRVLVILPGHCEEPCVWLGDAAFCTYKSRNQEVGPGE